MLLQTTEDYQSHEQPRRMYIRPDAIRNSNRTETKTGKALGNWNEPRTLVNDSIARAVGFVFIVRVPPRKSMTSVQYR
jgi:hypothetical protein